MKQGKNRIDIADRNDLRDIICVFDGKERLSLRDWGAARKALDVLIPSDWFMALAYTSAQWIPEIIYSDGPDKNTLREMLRVYVDVSDFFLPVLARFKKPVRIKDCRFVDTDELSNYLFFKQSAIYQRIFAPRQLFYLLYTPLMEGDKLIGDIRLNRHKECGEYSDDDIETMRILKPYFEKALKKVLDISRHDDIKRKMALIFEAYGLTKRQKEVVLLAARGQSNIEIAQTLGISLQTVKIHVRSALKKLGVKNRNEILSLESFKLPMPTDY